jgi:uncharacterized protein YqiB (DUF1249 family)
MRFRIGKKIRNMSKSNYSIDLIKQMAECDANFIRLLKLVPQLHAYRDKSFIEYALLDSVNSSLTRTNQSLQTNEPEKVLEGLASEFFISDLDDSDEKVTVRIKILEAFKYTTTLEITQKPELKKWMTNPSMLVRVYHDASTAEVVSYQGHRNLKPRYTQPNPKMYHADEKMQVNKFLGEWLTHCLKVGRSTKASELLFTI